MTSWQKFQAAENTNWLLYEISRSNTYWIDIESPAHIDRNRKTVDKIILQMQSSIPDK